MSKKQFKAESKKLLDLMINSIYTNKEIFLRELISNASDALDKLYYKTLTAGNTGVRKKDYYIEVTADKELRTLTIRDNGIGMTKEELEENLGTIAKSGSQVFKEEKTYDQDNTKAQKAIDIIGQFGVGFYSAFMVSDLVTVTSKASGSNQAFRWMSSGADGYSIDEIPLSSFKDSFVSYQGSTEEEDFSGTEIQLHLKEDKEGENYSTFLESYTIGQLVRKYSDYIRYPIKFEDNTLNTMEPIWKRQKSKVKPEDYNDYYKSKFGDYMDPVKVIRTSVEGVSSFTALMFIPGHAPFDYYSKDFEKGLTLYSSGVMIMEKCPDLLPDYFNFVQGLVDSQDLSLNISRETLQQDRQLKNIAKSLDKKIKRELEDFLKSDREGYEKFFGNFGRQLKYGLYDNFGAHKETLQDLVLFPTSKEKKLATLSEYVERMAEDQKSIYYASGESMDKIDLMPQTEYIKEKGFEIIYLTDEVDEFVIQMMQDYKDIPFMSITSEDITESESQEDKDRIAKEEEDNRGLLDMIKESLDEKVSEVKFSPRLTGSCATITNKGDISLEMEKVLKAMPMAESQAFKAERILELNPDHDVVKLMEDLYAKSMDESVKEKDREDAKDKITKYAYILYSQALLISGLSLEDPVTFAKEINQLIVS